MTGHQGTVGIFRHISVIFCNYTIFYCTLYFKEEIHATDSYFNNLPETHTVPSTKLLTVFRQFYTSQPSKASRANTNAICHTMPCAACYPQAQFSSTIQICTADLHLESWRFRCVVTHIYHSVRAVSKKENREKILCQLTKQPNTCNAYMN